MKNSYATKTTVLGVAVLFVLILGGILFVHDPDPSSRLARETRSHSEPLPTNIAAAVKGDFTTPMKAATPAGDHPGFELRPLAVVNESATHQWTGEDARDTNVIRRLAHNDAEYARMVDENPRIHRRQLVYRKDTAAAVLQRAQLSGGSVSQLTLPGFDGQEFRFDIEQSDLEVSKQVGSFRGHLAGNRNSMVTLAYRFGREAFTILSPDDGVHLQGHPRESGELVIISFDPDTFWPQPGGEPIKTSPR